MVFVTCVRRPLVQRMGWSMLGGSYGTKDVSCKRIIISTNVYLYVTVSSGVSSASNLFRREFFSR